ncbi:hypothetical protein [Clostridium sp. Marseille-P2415]|uniref:hypothetical protein n=1 Tax=Clostridium sp. Marseille-P2415 TaxID=1805471 RepID=UPI00098881AB|nr:hypothetical protein [Clostridium sp. Marseille-P2415]
MPKLTKTEKAKIPDTKLKKGKPAKTKQKKAKPIKAPKVKGKNPFSKNKKALVLLVAALMVVIVGAAAAIILLTLPKKVRTDEKAAEAPAYYFSKEEGISSVTEVVGERNFEKVTVPKTAQTESTESEEHGSEDSQGSQTQAAKESGETTAESNGQGETYKYLNVDDVSADLKSYRSYLEEEKNFIDVTGKKQTTESSAEESQEESTEFYQFAGPSKDSDSYLSITLESETGSYTVTACKEKQSWNTYFKDIWNQQKKEIEDYEKVPKATNTIEKAEETVRAQGQEKLGLPEAADSYEFIAAPGISKIDGKDYYTVRTYKRLPDDTLSYVATYLFDYNTSNVAFQYNEATREITPLK